MIQSDTCVSTALLSAISDLARDPVRGAPALGRLLGGETALVFLADPDLGVLLPAPGFTQTLPGRGEWRDFLSANNIGGVRSGVVPWPDAETTTPAAAAVLEGEIAVVVLGGQPDPERVRPLRAVLPLLASALRGERDSILSAGRAAAEREAAASASALAASLDAANRDLHHAVQQIEMLNEHLRLAMAETHHRVKNNLQVITALVEMQLSASGGAVPAVELRRIAQHIRSLAIIHDLLTREAKEGGDTEVVHASEVMSRLTEVLAAQAGSRTLHQESDDLALPVKQGTALAVLVNELVSNSLKHARGAIYVRLRAERDCALLEVLDHGPGFGPDFHPDRDLHTGLELVDYISRWDLGGEAEYANRPEGGARVAVRFPVAE